MIDVRTLAFVLLTFPSCVLPLHHVGDGRQGEHSHFHIHTPSNTHQPTSLRAAGESHHAAGEPCLRCLLMAFAPLAEMDDGPDAFVTVAIAVAYIRSGETPPNSHPAWAVSPRAPPRPALDIAVSA